MFDPVILEDQIKALGGRVRELQEENKRLRELVEIRAHTCECSEDEACNFVQQREAKEAENIRFRGALGAIRAAMANTEIDDIALWETIGAALKKVE